MRRVGLLVVSFGIAWVAAACNQPAPPAPESSTAALTAQTVANRYIVVFKKEAAGKGVTGQAAPDLATSLTGQYGGTVVHTYRHALQGAAMVLPPAALEGLRRDDRVAYVERDGVSRINASESNPAWGLDRIDQRELPLNQTYVYLDQAGEGVHAYVIDTGIYAGHAEFASAGGGSRVVPGYDFIDGDSDPSDCHGHGTHVAGTLGGQSYGVAKKVTLHSVRVLDCTGYGANSGVIAGIDWVTANHATPAVANMSLGGEYSQAVNDAVANSIAAGVTYGIAAGNDGEDACAYSPASASDAITVGATDSLDARPFFSNTGGCLDIFAPGVAVTSAWIGSVTATSTISGTSMAAPHVVGTAALWLGLHPTATPAAVALALTARATPDRVQGPGDGSPNLLLYAGNLQGGETAPEVASVSITPSVIESGKAGTVTVRLTDLAPAGGAPVTLSSNGPAIAVPGTLLVPGGGQAASIPIVAGPVGSPTVVTLTASYPGTVSETAAVTVLPSPTPEALTLSPTTVNGGASASATLVLSGPAPAGGAVIALASSNGEAAIVPATMTIPAGSSNGSITITTLPQWTTTKFVTISATYHGLTRSATLVVGASPVVYSLLPQPSTFEGGATVTCRLQLNIGAPVGGAVVALTSNNPTVHVPASVTVPVGASQVDFEIATTSVSVQRTVAITATYPAGHEVSTNLTILASPTPLSLEIAPPVVSGGRSATGTVYLSGPAPAGGVSISLLSRNTSVATVPATLAVAAGASAGSFPIATALVSALTSAWIDASLNGVTVQNTVGVSPAVPEGNAVYLTALRAPGCDTPGPVCDSGRLLDGRAQLGPESNAPNTIGDSCSDGTGGMYHDRSESLNRLAVLTVDGSNLAPGKQVRIEATVFAFVPTDDGAAGAGVDVVYPSDDRLDLYLTTDATARPLTWVLLTPTSIVPPMGESVPVLTHTFTLPATGASNLWAIRGNYRWSGQQAVCAPRSFDDYDDLAFAVEMTAPFNRSPVVSAGADQTVTLPAAAALTGTVTDDGLPTGTLTTTWSKVTGPGTVAFANASTATTSATFSAAGTYTLRLTADDGAASSSDDLVVTVNAGSTPCAGLCANPTSFTINGQYQSGNLGTGARCYQTTSTLHGGKCSHFAAPRTLQVNGTSETCNGNNWSTIPAKVRGGYCIQVSAGNSASASFTAW